MNVVNRSLVEGIAVLPDIGKSLRSLILVVSVLAVLSAVGVSILTMRASQPYYLLLGMELCIGLSGAIGVLFARGFFREGPGMALACVAGTFFVASFLGWLSVPNGTMTMRSGGSQSLRLFLVVRLGLAVVVGLVAAWAVLSRNVRSWHYVKWAAMTGVPLAGLALLAFKGRAWLSSGGGQVAAWVAWVGAIMLASLGLALFCACVHCTIRAFEAGRKTNNALTK